ncbi:hypothetical protein EW026_g8233 [Hermanssonia centrifuga]|uniref:Senescence domain-containing protein n=1 Tax=Hermanssonia centrifuga TaxID=98765 RepID=A0A4S4K4X7_9APHY|nr:hypothetical protein EW026_g8233 [Hermanssonia centrifuga]
MVGIEAAGDELGRSVTEHASGAAQNMRKAANVYLQENPPTTSPSPFSQTTHDVTATTSSATQSIYNVASTLTSAVSSVASTAGAWVSSRVGPVSPSTNASFKSTANAYDSATTGISAGTQELTNAAAEAVGDVVQNEWGRDARHVGGHLAESVGNIGGVIGQVAEVGTVAAVAGVKGAAAEQNKEGSGEWKNVSV